MKPSRKMDALIGEKVMGLEPWPMQDERWRHKMFKAPIVPRGMEPKPCYAPEYSTNIAAAWEILEGRNTWFESYHVGKNYCVIYQIEQYENGMEDQLSYCSNEDDFEPISTPHAICIASLRARGVL